MKKYKQLNLKQRYEIELLIREGYKQCEIAKRIGVHKSTISREISRNVPKRGKGAKIYDGEKANSKAQKREKAKQKSDKFTLCMKEYMRECLTNKRWSPELISVKGEQKFGTYVSHEHIYQYIWKAKKSNHKLLRQDKDLYKYLRHNKRSQKRCNQRKRRGVIPNRVPMSERPTVVEERTRLGDLEVGLMMGSNHKPGLIVMIDRTTLETELIKITSKRSKVVSKKIIDRLRKRKIELKTLTFDNGLEFADHEKISDKLEVDTYFTRPYTSQDKGSVENRIGLIRRFFPKGCNMEPVDKKRIREVQKLINNRPVRKFDYLSPIEKRAQLTI